MSTQPITRNEAQLLLQEAKNAIAFGHFDKAFTKIAEAQRIVVALAAEKKS